MDKVSEARKRIDRKIASASAALMSNTKWCKLFAALRDFVSEIKWKFVNDERIFTAPIPHDTGLLNDSFGDVMPYPYGPYKDVEWVLIPATYTDPNSDEKRPLPEKENDLEDIKLALKNVGQFPLVESVDGIRIIGYKWQ